MNIKKMYKKNLKLVYTIILLLIISLTNTLEGYMFSKNGFTYSLLFVESISFISTILLLNIVWCVFEDGKCITVKKTD